MIISFVLTLLIFSLFEVSYTKVQSVYFNLKNIEVELAKDNNEVNEIKEEKIKPKQYLETEDSNIVKDIWQIEIPKINLVAPIAEGTSQEVMLEYVGHFENTKMLEGNVGLAAHNRGYPINYFAKLKELEIGDEIIYKTKYGTKKYKVNLTIVIQDTDWSYLQESKENKITLITCVENQPSNRRCIQAVEIKEE